MPKVIFKSKTSYFNKHCDMYSFLSFTPGINPYSANVEKMVSS